MKTLKFTTTSLLLLFISTLLSAQGVPHPNSGSSFSGKSNDVLMLAILFIMLVSLIAFTIYKYRQEN